MNMLNKHMHQRNCINIWICLILVSNMCTMITCTRELRLLGMLSETGVSYKGAGSCLTAINMALEDINHREDILKGYNLTYNWVDSKCHAATALFRMIESLQDDRPYQMLLGPPCSTAAEATAQISHMWNLTQLSCLASSPILSDRTRFPRFARMHMSAQKLNIARIAILQEFNWKKVATVHQARDFFSAKKKIDILVCYEEDIDSEVKTFPTVPCWGESTVNLLNRCDDSDEGMRVVKIQSTVIDDFVQRIQDTNISVITQEIFANDPLPKVYNLKRHDARILIAVMYEDKARQLICAAYKVGLYGSNIVWFFVGWYLSSFWQNDLENIECTKEQMALVVEGAFLTDSLNKNPFEERGIANLTVSEFEYRYYNHPTYSPEWKDTDIYSGLCYDHIWTAALALDCTVHVLRENGHHKSLDKFTYADGNIGKIIFDCMGNISMTGVSGKTSFEQDSGTERVVRIERVQDAQRDEVGLYRQDKDPRYFEWIEGAIRWKSGIIPADSAQIKNEEILIPLPLYVVMASFGALGICLSLSFLGLNVIYRNNRYVKLSSPNINNMLLLGCILCYMTVFFKTTGTENASICRARIYCFSIGFTIMFGSLFSKTWRVYRIFIIKSRIRVGSGHVWDSLRVYPRSFFIFNRTNFYYMLMILGSLLPVKQIKDRQLFVVVCILVALILVLLIIWDIVGQQMIKSKFLPKEAYLTSDGTEVRPFVRVCWSKYSTYFTWALYIIQGALLTFGTFLAWETRNVHVQALNDSKKIGISLYNVVILSAVGVMLTLLLEDQEVLLYGITSGFLVFGTTVTQMLIFIPKVRAIVNKVEPLSTVAKNTIYSTHATTSAESCRVGVGFLQQPNEKQSQQRSTTGNI